MHTFRNSECFPFNHIVAGQNLDCLFKWDVENFLENITQLDATVTSDNFESQLNWIKRFENVEDLDLVFDDRFKRKIDQFKVRDFSKWEELDFLLEAVVPKLTNLKKISIQLNIHRCSQRVVKKLKALAENLSEMDLKLVAKSFFANFIVQNPIMDLKLEDSKIKIRQINLNSDDQNRTMVADVVRICPDLKVLELHKVKYSLDEYIFEDLATSKLKVLRLNFLAGVRNFELAVRVIELPLEELYMKNVSPDPPFRNSSLALALQCCPNLTKLTVDLVITDAQLQLIGKHLKKLKQLHLCRCLKLTDEGFQMMEDLSVLVDLAIQNGPNITDKTLSEFVKFNSLRRLKLKTLPNVTEQGVRAVKNNCPLIKTLVLEDLPKIPKNELDKLVNKTNI